MLASDSGLSPLLTRARGWLPPALLILALSALFAFGGDRGYFYRSLPHNENSAKNLALAENLSPSDAFRLFRTKRLAEDGSPYYDMYSRFPIGGTALIKLAIAPFDTLSARLAAARTLALLMFCGAAVFAYLAVARLAASRWIGLAAALIAFSSYYALYYGDAVAGDTSMDLFGVMLTFHGMVIFVQDGRFRQLPLKACAALLLGWHVYALLLAFIVFGVAREAVSRLRGRSACSDSPTVWNIHTNNGGGGEFNAPPLIALIRNRYMILGAATLAFGIIVLGSNLVNEYYAYGGETPARELPSLRSALERTGALESRQLNLPFFARQQLSRAGDAALPYALPWKRAAMDEPRGGGGLGILAVGAALVGTALARRHRALWAALALFGFFWAILARGNTHHAVHDFEALFYVGVPLALFGTALMGARRLWGERAPVAAALAAVVVFAVSAFQMQTGEMPGDAERPETLKAEMADFDAIREMTRGEAVAVLDGPFMEDETRRYSIEYYLAGSVLATTSAPLTPRMGIVKYVVSHRDYEGGVPLTPQNRFAFLYEVEPFHFSRAELRRVESAEPAARSDFDVYMKGDTLTYLRAPCGEDDARGRFFLSVHPVHAADLPEDRRELGHDNLNFGFSPLGIIFDGKCAIRRGLPHYPISKIAVGQWVPDEGEIWSAEIKLSMSAEESARYESVYQAAKSSGEPLIESDFDVYLNGDTLTYLKAPCANYDTRGRFFLSVHPVHAADLPEDRRELGHASLNFDFAPSGIVFGDKCMISRELPDYPIEKIVTGQWIPGGDRLWAGEAAMGE